MKLTTYYKFIALIGFTLLYQSMAAQRTVSLTPDKDAYLYMTLKPGYEYYANTNYGMVNKFYSGEWSASNYKVNQRSIVDFNLAGIPADAVILEARITFYSMFPQINDDYRHSSSLIKPNSIYKSNASYLERITNDWSETSVTYNTQPATSTSHRMILPESQTCDQNYIDFDVTGMVQDMFNNPGQSFGFMLRLANETKYSRMAFCSREYADTARWPRLVVKYMITDKLCTFYHHSFILKADGSLWAWGSNVSGELGDGTTTDRPSQVQIGSREWKQVSAGFSHSLALKTDGTLWAWGFNLIGQLGDGTNTDKNAPVQIGIENDWRQVSAGYNFSVGVKTDGTLWSWGYNDRGQLGDGTTSTEYAPVRVGTESDWKTVVARKDYTLAIKTDSTLWAWGGNEYGQLGDGTTKDEYVPVQIGTDKNWKSISAGWDHSLALKGDGTLWAWGYNRYGQLGDDTQTGSLSPMKIGTASDWKEISAGFEHSMAIKADGTLWTWGYNYYGQLGDGSDGNAVFIPEQIEGVKNCAQVAAGWSYSLILNSDGQQCGSGMNTSGQLGNGTTENVNTFSCFFSQVEYKSTASHASIEKSTVEQIDLQTSQIGQNYPNPAQGTTTIDYYVSGNAGDASIMIFNLSGIAVGQYPIANKGDASIRLDLQDLPAGIYFYSLKVDGKMAGEKKMVLIKP